MPITERLKELYPAYDFKCHIVGSRVFFNIYTEFENINSHEYNRQTLRLVNLSKILNKEIPTIPKQCIFTLSFWGETHFGDFIFGLPESIILNEVKYIIDKRNTLI